MALFQKSVLNEYLNNQDNVAVEKAYKKFVKYFHNPTTQQNIRDINEEGFQQKFLMELFVTCFGYVINPDPDYNLTTEFKNLKDAKKADGAILIDGKARAVIELKGTNTKDLEKCRQQAFDYHSNHPTCKYVITSNFEKLRFYINTSDEFEEFNLFTLSEKQFSLLYLCVFNENLLNNISLEIKEASIQKEEAITKEFYSDYSTFKRELFRDLVKLNMKNEVFHSELNIENVETANKNIKLNLFKKSQKLIDRFLFIFFGEDRGLLPSNSTLDILKKWKSDVSFGDVRPLYDIFKIYFKVLDKGRKGANGKAEIFAYNGGLFKPDPILESLIISDELLYKHTKNLSNYDFDSQVDVNILGHIFENSLNEIENVNAEIEGGEFDKQKSKRKKDGVFYTPKYITKYIVDNTIGKLCTEKKAELGVIEEEYFKSRKGRTKAKLQELMGNLESYREWLLQITILDPACGSGAFLNQALDFLIKEHQYIDELQTNLLGGGFEFPEIENTVLENNIFGVDLNEESVEIAKLSLWLRTAQPRRKLNDLSSNIKCGNSLIDSKTVAGDKAFKWMEEFPQIFERGGFDVVIGNPPYLNMTVNNTDNNWLNYYVEKFESIKRANSKNIFTLFNELSCKLVKQNSLVSFILPEGFLKTRSYSDCVKEMENYGKIYSAVYFEDWVFEDATTGSMIFEFIKNTTSEISFTEYYMNKDKDANVIIDIENPVITKYNKINYKTIDDYCELFKGMAVKDRKAYISEEYAGQPNTFLLGNCINRNIIINEFHCDYNELTIVGGTKKLEKHSISPRILIRRTGDYLCCVMLEKEALTESTLYSCSMKTDNIDLRYILALLNSKFLTYIVRQMMITNEQAFPQIMMTDIKLLKIPDVDSSIQNNLSKLSNILSEKTESHFKIETKFSKYIQSQFSIEKLSRKLQSWHALEFGVFINELNKAIKKVGGEKLDDKAQFSLMSLFEEQQEEAQTLKVEIDQKDREIDQMVYELYDLTENEIKIVDES